MMHYTGSEWVNLAIAIIVIVAAAWLILWLVQRFLPEVYQPARIIVGVVALIACLVKLAPLLS